MTPTPPKPPGGGQNQGSWLLDGNQPRQSLPQSMARDPALLGALIAAQNGLAVRQQVDVAPAYDVEQVPSALDAAQGAVVDRQDQLARARALDNERDRRRKHDHYEPVHPEETHPEDVHPEEHTPVDVGRPVPDYGGRPEISDLPRDPRAPRVREPAESRPVEVGGPGRIGRPMPRERVDPDPRLEDPRVRLSPGVTRPSGGGMGTEILPSGPSPRISGL